jgi:hypothetical protein
MGQKIAEELIAILQRDGVYGRKKRPFRDDNREFTEEDGDPGALDRGYIVVRRKDLD